MGPRGTVENVRYRPDPTGHQVLPRALALSLLWAGTAVDYIDVEKHHRRSETREAAKRLGIKRDLHLTKEAELRIAKWQLESREVAKSARTGKPPAP